MYKPGQEIYVKTTEGYVKCEIISRKGSYYLVRQNDHSAFGTNENRIITPEQYELLPKKRTSRPPDLH